MNKHQLIKTTAEPYLDGPLPVRFVCPVCLGGSSHEESLVIWPSDGNIFATCHRARCDVNTVLLKGTVPMVHRDNKPDALQVARAYAEGGPLTDTDFEWLKNKCGRDSFLGSTFGSINGMFFKSYPTWARHGKESGGLLLPMYDAGGQRRGCVIKPYDENMPKSLTYKDPEYDGMSWYLTTKHMLEGRVFLVEDGLSAYTLMQAGRSAVSLNGTLLNDDRMHELYKYNKLCYLCFDADATTSALAYAVAYGSRYKLKVVRLVKDFKNMGLAELETFFEENSL